MEKLLITRADTLVGANAAAVLADRMDVIGFTASTDEAASAALIGDRIRSERPNLVLHAGATAWAGWDLAGIDGVRVNARCRVRDEANFLTEAAAACREVGARLVFVTTDAVYSGPRMFHAEDGCSWSSSTFARAARDLEQTLRDSDALVLRSHVYGWMPAGGATNYAERMFHALTAELPCRVDARRHATPILATDFVRLAYEAYRAGLSGTYHLTGAERTSPYRFAAELAAALGVPGRNVRLEPNDDRDRRAYLEETSLNVGWVRKRLDRPMPLLREGLARFVDTAFNGFRERLSGTVAEATPTEQVVQAA